MKGPITKYFGSLSLDKIGDATKGAPMKVETHETYGKQIKVTAAAWEDGGISIECYNPDTKESFKLGSLRVSMFDNKDDKAKVATEDKGDLPF